MNTESRPWLIELATPGSADGDDASQGNRSAKQLPADTLGLALSGGGIRSAAFSLGIIQALAKSGWLKHIDFLSTVSGGGYTGSFLGRFFDQTRAGNGLAGASGDTAPGAAQSRVAESLVDHQSLPIDWIRQHANYLAPTGAGEKLFNLSTYWRNLISLLLVLTFLFMAILGLPAAIGYNPNVVRLLESLHGVTGSISLVTMVFPSWVSPFWIHIAELSLWFGTVPLAFAYWLGSQDRNRRFVISYFFALLIFAIALLFATSQPVTLVVFLAAVGWTLLSWWVISKQEGSGDSTSQWRTALTRNQLTYWLSSSSAITVLLLLFAAVDSAGIWLASAIIFKQLCLTTLFTWIGSVVGFGIAATPVVRTLAWYLSSTGSESKGVINAILRIPYLPTFIVLFIAFLVPISIISMLIHLTYGLGYTYSSGLAATVVASIITLLLGSREARQFVNRSGPLTVYSARLARVFLGAVNPNRLRHLSGRDVSHVIEGDDVPFHQYQPHDAGGPLHMINVAVNETYDVISDRGGNARKSHNLAIGPAGMSISKGWHSTWNQEGKDSKPSLQPLVDHTSVHPLHARSGKPAQVEALSLRQWMAISGAAISPGEGRNTSAARALVLTLANVRLGYWWDSSLGLSLLTQVPLQSRIVCRFRHWLTNLFQGQSLLLSELRGRFGGPWKRFWYLSDGGHFEYSGAYELLRRRVPFIIICDAGADKSQSGEIMADLMRIARIDWGAELKDLADTSDETLQQLGVPAEVAGRLGPLADLLTEESGQSKKHASLLRVQYVGKNDSDAWNGRKHSWVLYLKSSVNGDEPVDILTYRSAHPDFPNESTLDQFFDEQQWESYRKLGEHVGSEMFV